MATDKEQDVKHTPTPWQLYTKLATPREPYSITDSDGAVVAVVLWVPETMEPEDSEANAKFIVRAVNNHDVLVKELSDAYPLLQQMAALAFHEEAARFIPGDVGERLKDWIKNERVQAALASAQE